MFMMAYSTSFLMMCFACIPFGLGAGAIDTTLNNYVAVNYKAIHLNWLHAFWGVGTIISPLIIGGFLSNPDGWRTAGLTLGIIQAVILVITFCSAPVWFKVDKIFNLRNKDNNSQEVEEKTLGFFKTFKIKGIIFAIIGFFCYCVVEQTCYIWFSSMLVFDMNVDESLAATWVSLFFIGLVIGRFISGLVSLKIGDKNMIRIGEGITLIGIIFLTFKFNVYFMPAAVFIIGFGCAPIYPAIIHDTPSRFTVKYSASVMAVQVGCAYLSNVTIVPLFGVIGEKTTFLSLPYVLLAIFILMVITNELTTIFTKDKTKLLIEKYDKSSN
jgi:fucose permease